jgi:hypothetical protein
MSGYRVRLQVFDEASDGERQRAEQRFRRALEGALGDACLVVPVYLQVQRLLADHGQVPDPDSLSQAQRDLLQAWQEAETAALNAALGSHRYMGDAQFEILIEP